MIVLGIHVHGPIILSGLQEAPLCSIHLLLLFPLPLPHCPSPQLMCSKVFRVCFLFVSVCSCRRGGEILCACTADLCRFPHFSQPHHREP